MKFFLEKPTKEKILYETLAFVFVTVVKSVYSTIQWIRPWGVLIIMYE
ncbi:hypothetical protein KGY73_04395 [bacterium]|nr:hypothetical protein [bacterium]